MTPNRLHRCRFLAAACVLVVAGLSQAAAQFPPPPGQTNPGQNASGGAFPPPPGAQQPGTFPPPPGTQQSSAFPPPGASQSSAFPPPGASGGFSPTPGGGFGGPPPQGGGFSGPPSGGPVSQAERVCSTFPAIREEVEKSAIPIKTASERKATREEVCPLFKNFAAKEGKMVTFLETNQKLCGVPPKVITQVKANHAKTIQIRNNVCSAAPSGPSAPTLSDALGGPVIADDLSAKQPGRGTFDTLTGNALQR